MNLHFGIFSDSILVPSTCFTYYINSESKFGGVNFDETLPKIYVIMVPIGTQTPLSFYMKHFLTLIMLLDRTRVSRRVSSCISSGRAVSWLDPRFSSVSDIHDPKSIVKKYYVHYSSFEIEAVFTCRRCLHVDD